MNSFSAKEEPGERVWCWRRNNSCKPDTNSFSAKNKHVWRWTRTSLVLETNQTRLAIEANTFCVGDELISRLRWTLTQSQAAFLIHSADLWKHQTYGMCHREHVNKFNRTQAISPRAQGQNVFVQDRIFTVNINTPTKKLSRNLWITVNQISENKIYFRCSLNQKITSGKLHLKHGLIWKRYRNKAWD